MFNKIQLKGDELRALQFAQLALNEFANVRFQGGVPIIENVSLKRNKIDSACIDLAGLARMKDGRAIRFAFMCLAVTEASYRSPGYEDVPYEFRGEAEIALPATKCGMFFDVSFGQNAKTSHWELVHLFPHYPLAKHEGFEKETVHQFQAKSNERWHARHQPAAA